MQVGLITDNSAALPATKNTKTSFCEADPRLNKLFRWIATYVPHRPKTRTPLKPATSRGLAAKCESNPDALGVGREGAGISENRAEAKVDLFVRLRQWRDHL